MHLHRSSGPTREAFHKNTALTKRSIGEAFVPIDLRATVRAASSVVNQSKSLRVFLRPGAAVPHTTTLLLLSRWVVTSVLSMRSCFPRKMNLSAQVQNTRSLRRRARWRRPASDFVVLRLLFGMVSKSLRSPGVTSHPKDLDYYCFLFASNVESNRGVQRAAIRHKRRRRGMSVQ